MKIGIYAHCTIDSIRIGGVTNQHFGGPACYSGITARRLKLDVEMHTKFGVDFQTEYMIDNGIEFKDALSKSPTTRFLIHVMGIERKLYLKEICESIEFAESDSDGVLVSPIFDEISHETFARIVDDSEFVFLDPQGFLRGKSQSGEIFLKDTDLDLSKVYAIKADSDDMKILVGDQGTAGMKKLREKGIDYILSTKREDLSMLTGDRQYMLRLPDMEIYDTTGIGDIFSAAFMSTMITQNDALWAFCFAAGAVQAALASKRLGLAKIPQRGEIETNAAYFYNTVKFRAAP